MALWLDWLTISLALSSLLFIALYLYFIRNFNLWKKLGIPYILFLGNLKECALQKLIIGAQLKKLYEEHGDKPYVGIFSFDQPSLLVRDPELVKNILVKDSNNFADRIVSVDGNTDILFGRNLFTLKGQRWRQIRVNLTPVFTSGKMKNMFNLVLLCCKDLTDFMDRTTSGGK
jgi:cytochrome P450 family 6